MSKRLIKDYMLSTGLKPHTIQVSNQMRVPCRHARQRYHTFLEEKKKTQEEMTADSAKEIICMEIEDVQSKINCLDRSCKSLDEKFVSMGKKAEKSKDVVLKISEANPLKLKSEEQGEERRKLEEALEVLKVKRSNLKS